MKSNSSLNEYEIDVLRMVAGERTIPWGAWVGACLEYLEEEGYITKGPRCLLTERGKLYLKNNVPQKEICAGCFDSLLFPSG